MYIVLKTRKNKKTFQKEKELDEIEMNTENEDEIVLLLDRNLLSHPIMNLDTFQTIQGIDAPSNQKYCQL